MQVCSSIIRQWIYLQQLKEIQEGRYMKGYLFCQKCYIKWWGVESLGRASPYKTLLNTPPPPEHFHCCSHSWHFLAAISFKISFVQAVLCKMPHDDDKNADSAYVLADYIMRTCLPLQALLQACKVLGIFCRHPHLPAFTASSCDTLLKSVIHIQKF